VLELVSELHKVAGTEEFMDCMMVSGTLSVCLSLTHTHTHTHTHTNNKKIIIIHITTGLVDGRAGGTGVQCAVPVSRAATSTLERQVSV
jgi:hypothetical protein